MPTPERPLDLPRRKPTWQEEHYDWIIAQSKPSSPVHIDRLFARLLDFIAKNPGILTTSTKGIGPDRCTACASRSGFISGWPLCPKHLQSRFRTLDDDNYAYLPKHVQQGACPLCTLLFRKGRILSYLAVGPSNQSGLTYFHTACIQKAAFHPDLIPTLTLLYS